MDGRPLSFSGLGLRRHHKLPGTLPQRTEVQSGVSRALVEVTHQGWLEGGHLLRVPEAGFLERWCLLWGWVPAELTRSALESEALRQGRRHSVLALCKVALGLCWQPLGLLVRRAVPIFNHHGVFTVFELQSQRGLFRLWWRGPYPGQGERLC